MQKVKIIPPISLTADLNSIKIPIISGFLNKFAKFGFIILALFPFVIGLAFLQIKILYPLFLVLGAVLLLISIVWVFTLLYGGSYKPGFSFIWWRVKRKHMLILYRIIAILILLFLLLIVISKFIYKGFSVEQDFVTLLKLVTVIGIVFSGIYTMIHSFKIHEDVDYIANQEASELLGMELDERIQASYEKLGVILIVTDKKIVFINEGRKQNSVLSKEIKEISEIGIVTSIMTFEDFFNSDIYLFLVFSDDQTKIRIKMSLDDKITSNPDLFIRKFLTRLDNVLLGKTDKIIKSRRRVSISANRKSEDKPSNCGLNPNRSIDLSETIQKKLQNPVQVKSGRVLNL